jgi:DtxR family Mn-dependent transcriptional regulator
LSRRKYNNADFPHPALPVARHDHASTTALAQRLGIAPASVTGMLQRLSAFTPPGERTALQVIRSHRLLETYLVKLLGYTWDALHAEACRLEHVISAHFQAPIAHALGNPARDPHGELVLDPAVTGWVFTNRESPGRDFPGRIFVEGL